MKIRWKPWVARAVCIGLAIARFLGTSSAKTMVTTELTVSPIATAIGSTAPSGIPAERNGPEISREIAGSARKPIARLVTVMPTCAPDSWVDSDLSALSTPTADASPVFGRRATLDRSTVTNENSAATKNPAAATRRSEAARSSHAVSTAPRPSVGSRR